MIPPMNGTFGRRHQKIRMSSVFSQTDHLQEKKSRMEEIRAQRKLRMEQSEATSREGAKEP